MFNNKIGIITFFRIALTSLILLIAIGIDHLIFDIFNISGKVSLGIAFIGFMCLIIGGILNVWNNDLL